MAVVSLDFHEPDDTLIGTLDDTELIALEFRPALQELGAISLTVSRHLAAASSALLEKGNLVKVRIPAVDADPIALFVLKDGDFQLIDSDEEGGEHLTLTGPGGLDILRSGRLNEVPSSTNPVLTNPTFRGSYQVDGYWTWHGEPYGAILRRCIEEGQEQPGTPLAAITVDFDREEDSDGNPWAVIPEDFQVPIGTDILTMANRMATGGDLYLVLTPDMVLHAYQTYGRNLTGAFAADNVRFEKGVNILTELTRKTTANRVTHLITRDMDGVYRTFVTPDAFDQAVYGFLSTDQTNDPDQIEKIALNTMAASDTGSESYILESLPGVSPEDGWYLPGPAGTDGHFWPGDAVTIHTGTGEHDLNAQTVTLSAVSIVLDVAADDSTDERAARSLRIVPEVAFGTPLPAFTEAGDATGTGAPGCVCLKLCIPGQMGTDLDDDFERADNLGSVNSLGESPQGHVWATREVVGAEGTLPGAGIQDGRAVGTDGNIYHITELDAKPTRIDVYGVFRSGAGDNDTIAFATMLDPLSINGAGRITGFLGDMVHVFLTREEWRIDAWPDHIGEGSGTYATLADDVIHHWVFEITSTGITATFPDLTQEVVTSPDLVSYNGPHVYIQNHHPSDPVFADWERVIMQVSGGVSGTTGDGPAALVGTGNRAARCDHNHLIEALAAEETDTGLVLRPDGSGGVVWDTAAGVTDHGALTGLADDDHPQYTTAAELTAALDALQTEIESLRWEAVTDGENVFVWESDDLVYEWKAY